MSAYTRFMIIAAAALHWLTLSNPGFAEVAQIRIGKVPSGTGFHIPSYIAMERGFFKKEGLLAKWVEISGRAMTNAALLGDVDFVPVPTGGALAALRGADIRYVVGQSLKSQWTIVSSRAISNADQLRGKTVAYGRPGDAEYDEGVTVLGRFFQLEPGRDYKVISIFTQRERVQALVKGSADAALMSIPHSVQASNAGMKILIRTADYLPRVGGCFWARTSFIKENPETTKKFIRAIAHAILYFRDNRAGSTEVLKKYLGIQSEIEVRQVWDELRNVFGAELPRSSFRAMFDVRRQAMIAEGNWPIDRPLPDPEYWLLRNMLESTLKEIGYQISN